MELIKNVNFAKYLADISFLEAETIKQASSFQDAVDDYYDNGAGKSGMLLPWERTHDTIQLADGELSIWAGVNGHGKSVLVGQVVMWAMKTERVLIASLEMKPHQTIIRMAAQAAGCTPSRDFVGEFLDENNMMKDAKGYHKALYAGKNIDKIVKHFYDQGRADAIKETTMSAKNIDMSPRATAKPVIDTSGRKFRVLSGDDSSGLKFKIRK